MDKSLKKKLIGGEFKNVPAKRSMTMSKIRGKGNKTTEVRFRFALVRAGIKGWKLHPKGLHGSPDIYFPESNLAIFLDGCFWHGCPICGHVPKTRSEFWKAKFNKTKTRDKNTNHRLANMGITVLRFWEHEISSQLNMCIDKVSTHIKK